MERLLFLIGSFLLGSVPFGILVARAFGGPDPRTVGSGNIGATNVARAAGLKAGVITLILDVSKGVLPVVVARSIYKDPNFLILCGLFAILGHCLSPFLKFKGGKGVATGAGAFLAINPKAFLCALAVFIFVFLLRRIVSLASITSSLAMPLFVWLFADVKQAGLTALISLFIIYRHKDNIRRLLKGEEKPFSPGA